MGGERTANRYRLKREDGGIEKGDSDAAWREKRSMRKTDHIGVEGGAIRKFWGTRGVSGKNHKKILRNLQKGEKMELCEMIGEPPQRGEGGPQRREEF
jgi:hypothetical protein